MQAAAPATGTTGATGSVASSADNLVKVYGSGATAVRAVDGISVTFRRGSFTAIMGASGSGKSTLMHCLAGLDAPTSGRITVGDTDITGLADRELTELRRDRIGFVFQSFNLLPTLSARQNILLPLDLAGRRADPATFDALAASLRITGRLDHRPSELSGGEQQRVAVARALVGSPDVIFADEPTGMLDSRTGHALLAYLRTCVRELGQTVVMVTHDPIAASYADRAVLLADGRVAGELADPGPDDLLAAISRLQG
jgi:putative ABC transport system ATP-binding protein